MNVAFINPFIESTLRSLEMMASIAAEKAGLSVKEDLITTYDISAIIGITGDTSGSIILSFPVALACRIASNMLMEEISTLDKSVEDAIGEIGNIVVGDARRLLIQDGIQPVHLHPHRGDREGPQDQPQRRHPLHRHPLQDRIRRVRGERRAEGVASSPSLLR